jgi:N-ethylmaleimide reductase
MRAGFDGVEIHCANDSAESNPQAVFGPLVEALNQRGIAFIHFVEGSTGDMAIDAIALGRADAVAFGRAYISNPDLVQRLKANAPLAKAHSSTFYVPGPERFIDYPTM